MDQAEQLRKIIGHTSVQNLVKKITFNVPDGSELLSKPQKTKKARIITVTSGKGGVGKTNFSVNLALALMDKGLKVVVLDADFGLANIEIVLGIAPKYTLLDVLQNKKNLLEVISKGPNNIKFISGGSGITKLARISKEEMERFTKNIKLLDSLYDVVVVDTGAGVSENVLNFVLAADDVILVTTPEPTSITDAYALIKMAAGSDYEKKLQILVNRVQSDHEGYLVYEKLKRVTEKFVGLKIDLLGMLPKDYSVEKAVLEQQPFLIRFPKSQISKGMFEIARKVSLVEEDFNGTSMNHGASGFLNKLTKLIRGEGIGD
jgi:flagellar biosynthesis protein FlhG